MGFSHCYVIGLFGAAAMTLGILLIYRHLNAIPTQNKAKGPSKKHFKSSKKSNPLSLTVHSTDCETNSSISSAELQHLLLLLPAANTTKFLKIMNTLIQISNDNVNIPSFRSSIILDNLFSQLTLGGDGEFLRSVNVHVLNIFTNIIVDDTVRTLLESKIDRLFDGKLPSLSDNELIALFRLLGNFAMMNDSANAVARHFSELFDFAACENFLIRRQAFTVLLNLSCDSESVKFMLKSEVSVDAEGNLKNFFQEKDEIILSKSLKFLSNLYMGLQSQNATQLPLRSLSNCLLNVKDDLNLQITLLSVRTISMADIYQDVQRFGQILEGFQ